MAEIKNLSHHVSAETVVISFGISHAGAELALSITGPRNPAMEQATLRFLDQVAPAAGDAMRRDLRVIEALGGEVTSRPAERG